MRGCNDRTEVENLLAKLQAHVACTPNAETRVMEDRSNFWKVVDRTKPSKLRAFAESELRACQDYFLEIQSDSTLPPNEIITASERLTLIRSEIDLRHGDAKHRQTQRLARWAIGVGMVSVAGAIISGVAQCVANKPTRENWPATIGTPAVATPLPMELPTPTPELTAMPPTATPELTATPTVPAVTAPTPRLTPRPTPTEQRRKKRRTRPQTMRKTDQGGRVSEFFRSLFGPKPTPVTNGR
jgi:hypothetical protein